GGQGPGSAAIASEGPGPGRGWAGQRPCTARAGGGPRGRGTPPGPPAGPAVRRRRGDGRHLRGGNFCGRFRVGGCRAAERGPRRGEEERDGGAAHAALHAAPRSARHRSRPGAVRRHRARRGRAAGGRRGRRRPGLGRGARHRDLAPAGRGRNPRRRAQAARRTNPGRTGDRARHTGQAPPPSARRRPGGRLTARSGPSPPRASAPTGAVRRPLQVRPVSDPSEGAPPTMYSFGPIAAAIALASTVVTALTGAFTPIFGGAAAAAAVVALTVLVRLA